MGCAEYLIANRLGVTPRCRLSLTSAGPTAPKEASFAQLAHSVGVN